MKVQLESTEKIVTVNEVGCRVWEGTTAAGVPVMAFLVRIMAPEDADQTEFERDLLETRPASAEALALPTRLVL